MGHARVHAEGSRGESDPHRPRAQIRSRMESNRSFVRACLIGLALALLAVGVVSGTFIRHVVQILPMLLAVLVLHRRPAVGAYAALPIFVFWILIVFLIWLFLLGLTRIVSGHFTLIEILLTIVMAACCAAG